MNHLQVIKLKYERVSYWQDRYDILHVCTFDVIVNAIETTIPIAIPISLPCILILIQLTQLLFNTNW